MKNNKGITMIILVITIIVMLILTSFAVYYSTNIAPEARIAASFQTLKEVKMACQRALNEIEIDPTLDEYYFFGKNINATDNENAPVGTDGITALNLAFKCGLSSVDEFGNGGERTYYVSGSDDPVIKRRAEKLEMTGLGVDSFVVDLENDKYYIVGGVRRDSSSPFVYEYRDVEMLYSMLTVTGKN
jgi:hypothetical protein